MLLSSLALAAASPDKVQGLGFFGVRVFWVWGFRVFWVLGLKGLGFRALGV